MAFIQKNREIEIISPLGTDVLLLREMIISEELGRLFTINLEVGSVRYIKFEELLGQNISIRLNLVNGKRFFNGFVSSISQGVNEGQFASYYVTVKPWLWFLSRTSDCRIFQNRSVPDIIKEVLQENGFTDINNRLSGKYRTWDYCVQYRETDFNFFNRLIEQEGIYYYFIYEQGKHTLCLADDLSSHEKMTGCENISYYPPDQAAAHEEECISDWRIVKKIQSGVYSLNEYDFKRPKADLKADSSIIRDHSKADYEIYDYPGEYIENSDGSYYAKIRIQELQRQYESAEGHGNVRGLICGGLFKLNRFPRDDQNREYLVTSVIHNVRCDSFESASQGTGNQYSNSFSAIESKTSFRAARITPKPIVQGPQTAVVVGPSGEEIYTDEYGRVKVQFHWDRYGKFDENSSCWIRVSQVHAGKGFGGIDIPRIGEEVIVEFLEGDPDRPIITGRVYNDYNKPPTGLPTAGMVSGLKSNSTPGGGGSNSILLDDTKEKEKLSIHAQYNMDSTVENDLAMTVVSGNETRIVSAGTQTVNVKGDTSLIVGAGNRVVNVTGSYKCDTTNEINLQAPSKITLSCGGSVIIMEPSKITLVAGGGASLTLDGNASMSSPGECTVEAPKSTLSGSGSTTVADASGVAVTGPKVSLNG